MKRIDRIKLSFTRNWNLPGKERLSAWLKPSAEIKVNLKDGIVWLSNEDIAIYTTADNYMEWTILNTGTYEDEIGKLIKISLNTGDVALDIGSNIGLQSLRMSRHVTPSGKVYAFEPLEYLQEKFRKNIALNSVNNVTLLPIALSDKPGEAVFKINKQCWNQGTFSLIGNGLGNEDQKVIIKVGDELPEIQSLAKLALIKIDVEGFEYQVLSGLKETLQKHRPHIIFEYDSNYWAAAGQNIVACYNFLTALNYKVYQINSVGCELIANADDVISGNLFCIPQISE